MSSPYSFLTHNDSACDIDRLFGNDPLISRSKAKYRSSPKSSDEENLYGKKKEKYSPKKRAIYDNSDLLRDTLSPYDPTDDFSNSREQVAHYRRAAELAHSEHAALLVKNTSLQNEVSDLKNRLAAKEVLQQEMKGDLDKYKEGNARQSAQIQSLKEHIREMDQMSLSVSGGKAEQNAEMYSLKRDNKDLHGRVRELENRLGMHLLEREKSEQKASTLEKKLQEIVSGLSSQLHMDVGQQEEPVTALLNKVDKVINEYFLQKTRLSSLEDTLAAQQAEFKASRDTIMKLVSEAEKQKKTSAGYVGEIKTLRMERDEAVLAIKSLEREKEILLEKIRDEHKEWGSIQQELMEKEKKMNEMDRNLRTTDYEARASHSLHQTFINQLATILSNGFMTVPRTEEAVKERIQELRANEQSWKSTNDELQEKVLKLTKQLEQQRDLYHEAASKSYKVEEIVQEHQESLKHLKGKLATEEMIKEGLNLERKKLKKFLVHLAEKLRISRDISCNSLTSQYETILKRAEEMSKPDKDGLNTNKSLIYNLQKKVNSQKEKLELKFSQIEQLEKKIKQLEREKEHQLFMSAENSAGLTAQKLQKKVEKLQGQLSDMKIANQNLTARLDDVSDLKERLAQQKRTIEELSKNLEKMEKIKEKAAKKVVSLKTELDYTEQETRGEKLRSQHMVDSVANELHTAKRALEEVARREKQLVDFRETITRMMGFNINTLAVPDHEILGQLKRILRSHGPINMGQNDRSKLPYGFRTGVGEQEYAVQHVNSF
ncbi:coiled-coil domain-containing protein 170-like [Bombina bombina]|uniref:coiled-coil domain-containing protein 170-like n=1 Tax=Bombina bombina TaxID=8345 RepID=UPI00235AA40B|nr:coiled-coil domain-containing protein 170-like [Bombina bombina]